MALSKKSKEKLIELIKNEFDKINFNDDWIYDKSTVLISLANEIGLKKLAQELKEERQNITAEILNSLKC